MNRLPRSLFLKILLWFGMTMLTMIVITFIVGEVVTHHPRREGPQIALAGYDDVAAQTYERDGREALAAYLDHTDRATHVRTFLYGPQLTELSGRHAPPCARQLAESVTRTKKPALSLNEFSPMLALPVSSSRNEYVWVAEFPPGDPG